MTHGGKRTNAGRKSTINVEQVVNDLIVPALQFIIQKKNSTITITEKDILAAYGKTGLAIWKEWFEINIGCRSLGEGKGRVAPIWKLKLTMMISANHLLMDVNEELQFPPLKLKEVKHKKDYDAFWREHKKLWEKWTKEGKINYPYPAPQPYVPLVHITVINNTTNFAQWAEMVDGSARGDLHAFTYVQTPSQPFLINDSDVPF